MVTCYLRYEIDPYQLDAFEEFARRWIDLERRSSPLQTGQDRRSAGASDVVVAVFGFMRPLFAGD